MMVKSRLVTQYDDPDYTVGLGGSGGAIQQYVYGQNHPGPARRRDPAVLLSGHGHADDPRRRLRAARALDGPRSAATPARLGASGTNRTWLEGFASSDVLANPYLALTPWLAAPGSTEYINGWRGLSPLALNPNSARRPG